MSTSGTYKRTARQSRNMVVEDFFDKGIFMSDAALDTGLSRNLVNLRFNTSTKHLVPRGGLQKAPTIDVKEIDLDKYITYYPLRSDLLITSLDNVYPFTVFVENTGTDTVELPGIGGVPTIHKRASVVKMLAEVPNINTSSTPNNNTVLESVNIQSTAQNNYNVYYSNGPKNGINIIKDMAPFKPLPKLLGCTLLNTFIGLQNTRDANNLGRLYSYSITESTISSLLTLTAVPADITPMSVNAAFAVKYGYNMLAADPYAFTNEASAVEDTYTLYGLLPKTEVSNKWKLTTDYRQGTRVRFFLNWSPYAGSTAHKIGIVFEYRLASDDNWEHITGGDVANRHDVYTLINTDSVPDIWCDVEIPENAFQIKVLVCGVNNIGSQESPVYEVNTDDVKTMAIYSFSGGRAEDTTTKPKLVNYDLYTAQDILSWKRRVCLYGVTNAPNLLFLSDIDTPSYFPYPNNIIEYDFPILKVISYLDSLLVFTTDGIYQTTLGDDGNTFITKQVVGNIHLTVHDIYSIQTVKNMIFYKTAERYYMLVPSSRYTTTEQLQIAPISVPINYLLDNFETEFRKLLQDMYGNYFKDISDSFLDKDFTEIIPTTYSTFTEGDSIRINYGFSITNRFAGTIHVVYSLIYDTLNRIWLSDILELSNNRVLNVYRTDLLGITQYLLTDTVSYIDEDTGSTIHKIRFEILQYSNTSNADFDFNVVPPKLPTRQFLDTGFRAINDSWKKRLRELQIKISTPTDDAIFLQPVVYIDDELRANSVRPVLQGGTPMYSITNENIYEVAYGAQYLEEPKSPESAEGLKPDLTFSENTIDGYSVENKNNLFFRLNNEFLTAQHLNTMRFKITGKGYCPRLQLNIHTDAPYELHNISWVFRNMNAR